MQPGPEGEARRQRPPFAPAGARRLVAEARRRRPHLALACVAGGLALAPAGFAAAAALAVLAATVAAWSFGSRAILVAVLLVMAGSAGGAMRLETIDRPARAAAPGSMLDAEATLLERPRPGLFGTSAPMRIDTGRARGLKILARSSRKAWRDDPGTRFHLTGLVRRPRPPSGEATARASGAATEANAGAPGTPGWGPLPARGQAGDHFDFAAFLRSRGIGREVRVESLRRIGRRGGPAGVVDSMRRRVEAAIGRGLTSERAALARGMVLGEDGEVSEATREDFRRSGLAHLLAASGQNVALLCALVLPLLMLAGASQRTRVTVLLPLVAVYVALAGSGASIVRAGLMAGAGLVALAAGRRASAVYALLLAAAITLALNPRATADPGWQLSFAAVGGMLALAPLVQRRLAALPRALAEASATTVAATLATAPLLAHEFGAVSPASLPANLAAFPAVAPIMWIGMGEAALEQVAAAAPALAAPVHALESLAAPPAGLALRWVAAVAGHFAEPGWAQAEIRLGVAGMVAAYAAIAAAAVVIANAGRIRRANARLGGALDWLRAITPASRRAYAAPLVALMLAAGAQATAPPRPPPQLTVDFLDVGQGDATLIRDPTGAAVLFDGGVPEARVDRALRRLGIRRLSVVVATHQSRDHHGGLLQVVRRFPVGLFLDGRDGVEDAGFAALEREVERRHIPRRATRAGERLRVGSIGIQVLWPPRRRPGEPPPGDPNDRATVAIVSSGGFDLLLSADAESQVLLPLGLPRVDAMKVPHHGSADPGLPQLLDRLRPRVAAIETGRGNRYGHPRRPTLDALRGRVPRVYRTDRDGTVELGVSGDRIAIRTHR